MTLDNALLLAIGAGILAIAYGVVSVRWILAQPAGNARMQEIAAAIQAGAQAYLNRQYSTIAIVGVILFVVLGVALGWATAGGFATGAILSGLTGYIGMFISVRANVRTAQAAHSGINAALKVAFRGGAITGMLVVGLGLLGVAGYYLAMAHLLGDPEAALRSLVGLAFGGSLISIFARLGGGIFTKGADVGADLVGKVEAGIPEDDPRNPAVIADLVGDNVGDCAGRGADIFESTAAENVGAMILGAALYPVFGIKGILFPLIVQAINLIASIVGVSVVHSAEDEDPMHALNKGYYVTSLLALVGFAVAIYFMLGARWWLLASGICGIITSFLFVRITEYYTETRFRPVQSIAEASLTGPATNIIQGLAVGMETPALPVIVISAALLLSYYFGVRGLAGVAGISDYAKGIYGTAIATMGML